MSSNNNQNKKHREKIDKLFGITDDETNNSKKYDIKISDLNSNTISNISNLGDKELNKNDSTIVNDVKSTVKETTNKLTENIKENTQKIRENTKKTINKIIGKQPDDDFKNKQKNQKVENKTSILKIIIITFIFLAIILGIYYYVKTVYLKKTSGINLLENTKEQQSPPETKNDEEPSQPKNDEEPSQPKNDEEPPKQST